LIAYINQFVSTVGTIVGGILDSVAMVLTDLWNLFLFPALQQFITSILPALTQFSTEFISTIGVLFNELKAFFDMIWKDALAPALSLISEVWSGIWEGITNTWEQYGAPIFAKIRTTLESIGDYL